MRNHLAIEELRLAKALTAQLIRDCDVQVKERILQTFDKEIKRLHTSQVELLNAHAPRADLPELAK